jgi:predicted ATPase
MADGTAKLGDFGLALARDHSRLSVEGLMVGTVSYMAPEQVLGRSVDARTDLYALGAMLYEMLAGRPPFVGDDAVAIVSQHIHTAPVVPSWHNPAVPAVLDALIVRLLAKTPAERPASAAAVREALAAVETAAPPAAEPNPLARLASGVFVGREREMAALRASVEEALSGSGRLLLLGGEPGIGKTRTAQELATYAQLRGMQVLWGRCYEGGGAPAYWPWVQALRAYVHERPPQDLLAEMGRGAADIAQVVSAVRERFPELPTPPALEPESARFRLFDSLTTFLKNAAARQPLLVVLDDLHWGDPASLLLLEFLAREMTDARVVVVGTYRDVEVRRQHRLFPTLAGLAREAVSRRMVLGGLGAPDVARYMELTAGHVPPTTVVAAVARETEGNPFFVGEVVRWLVAEGRFPRVGETATDTVGIPPSVREVIGRRLDQLSAECNRALTVAAVVGREFGLDVLERVSDVGPDRLLDVLDEAFAARVVTDAPGHVKGRYSFAHALIRETLYGELTTPRRIRLHREIAETLEAINAARPEPVLAQLA